MLNVLIYGVIIVATGFALLWFVIWADRRRIVRHIQRQGGHVLRVERSSGGWRRWVSEESTTFWRVRYRNRSGELRQAECFASFLRCKIWRDEPVEDN